MNLYEILGVPRNATTSTIKAAFRKLAGKHHPDRDGGDKEKFQEVQKAYAILSDDEKRAHYDQTGEEQHTSVPIEEQARNELRTMFLAIVDANADLINYRKTMEDMLTTLRKDIQALQTKLRRSMNHREKVLKALKGKATFLQEALEASIATIHGQISSAEAKLQLLTLMGKLLADGYDYTEAPKQQSGIWTGGTSDPYSWATFSGNF